MMTIDELHAKVDSMDSEQAPGSETALLGVAVQRMNELRENAIPDLSPTDGVKIGPGWSEKVGRETNATSAEVDYWIRAYRYQETHPDAELDAILEDAEIALI